MAKKKQQKKKDPNTTFEYKASGPTPERVLENLGNARPAHASGIQGRVLDRVEDTAADILKILPGYDGQDPEAITVGIQATLGTNVPPVITLTVEG